MSVHVMSLVWASTVPAPERFTLLALADRADEEGVCWPAIGTLAAKCCTGESTIRRHLRSLKQQGVLSVQLRIDSSSIYTINLSRLRALDQAAQSDTPQSGRGCQSGRGKQRRPAKTDKHPRQSGTPLQDDSPSQNDQATPVNLSSHPSQSDTQYVSDSSREPSGDAPKRATRGTRLPEDWVVSPELVAWARANCPDIDGRLETERFKNHFHAAPGQKGVKLDWDKTFKNWMLLEQKKVAQQPSRRGGASTLTDRAMASIDVAFDEYARRNGGGTVHQLSFRSEGA